MAQGIDLYKELKKDFDLKEVDIRTYSPLSLAYIGDCVFDLVVRSYVVGKGNTSNNNLHRETTRYVSARAQSVMADDLINEMTEEELAVYKRGKNSKTASGAKNASPTEYHKATGIEALMGYLYLTGQTERMVALIKRGMELTDERINS
ncbi:MAG: ribonuclease III [Lachnospiraceae bacterium]|nr:ribonuclease III [Lachnospiraceae bacterium]